MILTLIISALAFMLFVLSVFLFPQIKIFGKKMDSFWLFPIIAVAVLLITSTISVKEVIDSFTTPSAINPIKILILFFSMTLISIFLDEAGFFEYLAAKTTKASNGSQKRLFIGLYVIISLLTVFTSNDIIILTFTPFICYFCKNAKINALPYLIMEFVAANTWSLLLIIGNPTNIYIATALEVNFLEYTMAMLFPTIAAGLTSLLIMRLLFRKNLKQPMLVKVESVPIKDKFLATLALVMLSICIILLAVVSFVHLLEMYLVSLICLCVLVVIVLIYRIIKKQKPSMLIKTILRAPFSLIPFVLSMFIIVLCFSKYGITEKISSALGNNNSAFVYGITSYISANILNNIPMSVLFSEVASHSIAVNISSYAVIIASNIGAILTPVGALAGIMWSNIIAKNSIPMSIKTFVKYGVIISFPTLLISLAALSLIA